VQETRRIIDEQNLAYEESLRADQATVQNRNVLLLCWPLSAGHGVVSIFAIN